MKKLVMVVILITGIGYAAKAQSFSIGPNIGVGSTWIDNFKDKKFKTGYKAGVSLIYSTKSSFGIGADVKYSFEGGERQFTSAPYNTDQDVDLNYLRIPIKAMWFFNHYGDRIRPKVSLGPSFGFLLGGDATTKITSSNGALISNTKVDSKDYWDHFDLGVTGAVGLNIRLVSKTWLNLDLAYYHGLTDNSEKNPSYTTNTNTHNRNIELNVGVNFGL